MKKFLLTLSLVIRGRLVQKSHNPATICTCSPAFVVTACFDHCRFLRSRCQPWHGLVSAWSDTLRQRTTLDILNAQHARVAFAPPDVCRARRTVSLPIRAIRPSISIAKRSGASRSLQNTCQADVDGESFVPPFAFAAGHTKVFFLPW
jgi:hypothetical protein